MGISSSKSRRSHKNKKKVRVGYTQPGPIYLHHSWHEDDILNRDIPKPVNNHDLIVSSSPNINNNIHNNSEEEDNKIIIKTPLVFDDDLIEISERDCFSQATLEIIYIIFSHLSIEDICRIQRVSRCWYKSCEANAVWKDIVKRDSIFWTSKDCVHRSLRAEGDVRWKDLVKDMYRKRECGKCGGTYRLCYNTPAACVRHSGIRDLVEDRGIPSGVYWLCCLEPSKHAHGCTVGYHEEKRVMDIVKRRQQHS